MNYNVAIIVAVIITMLLALGVSSFLVNLFFDTNSLKKVIQLIGAIFFMTTFYTPIKFILLKYMDIKGTEDE